jgi:hypothetical protein
VWLPDVVGSNHPVQIAARGSGRAAGFIPPRRSENGAPGTLRSMP